MDLPGFEKLKTNTINGSKELANKNNSIYMEFVPTDISTLPKIEKKIMVAAKPLPVNINLNFEYKNINKFL